MRASLRQWKASRPKQTFISRNQSSITQRRSSMAMSLSAGHTLASSSVGHQHQNLAFLALLGPTAAEDTADEPDFNEGRQAVLALRSKR